MLTRADNYWHLGFNCHGGVAIPTRSVKYNTVSNLYRKALPPRLTDANT